MKEYYFSKKIDILKNISFLFFILFTLQINIQLVSSTPNVQYRECSRDKPVQKLSTGECVLEYCTAQQYSNLECNVTNPVIKKQWINEFLYETEKSLPIYSSIGTDDEGDVFLETNLGMPYSTKRLFTLKSDGREYIDGIKRNIINLGNNYFSKSGEGVVVMINGHKCYMKLAANESLEMYDFDDKKYTFANLQEKLGYKVKSEKNTLLRTSTTNTFIFTYISSENYLMMQKFKVVSNDANNCIQIRITLREDIKYLPSNTRSCMITAKQYIECIDVNPNQIYVIRIYDSNLNFLKEYQLEKNEAPSDRAYYTYHETVWLKDEVSIFTYYTNTGESGAKPIMVLKKLTVRSNVATLSNLNTYLTRDVLFPDIQRKFSDTENSLAIFNSYYYALSSITLGEDQHLILALANIFNDDYTIDTHYFDVPLTGLYDINYQSGLRAFGYKNAYGVQLNYLHHNTPSSGFIIFGYANTTDPEPVNRLFDKYSSYTIKVRDYYKGIENNLFCYVFVHIQVTEVPSSLYFTVKSGSRVLSRNSIITLNDVITITKVNGRNPPAGRYVLGITPFLNEANYQDFKSCAIGSNMFGKTVPTDWTPDEYYGRTIEFKFTVGVDCFENCENCIEKGTTLNDQKCTVCKNGYYFVENSQNCFGEIPEGYYFNETKKVYIECYESCKTCSMKKTGNKHNCKLCKNNYLLYPNSNCLNCKSINKYVNYEQTECIDNMPDGYYVNDTDYNTIDKCNENCLTCSGPSKNENDMKCLTCDNNKGFYLLEGTNNCVKDIKEGEYLDKDDNKIKKCDKACKTCSNKPILNNDGDVINCDTCNTDDGYYLIEDTTICTNKKKDDYYYDDDCKCYKKCYKDCLTCSGKEIDKYYMNCLTCPNGYIYFSNTKNCLNCKSINKYVNYAQTECIDKIPDGYYLNDTELNTIDKCHPNCQKCAESSSDDEDMKCLSCDNNKGYYFISGTKNCEKIPLQGYYLDEEDNTLKKCYKNCLTCSQGPVANEKGIITNMNCDTCNELKGLFLIKGTKNCDKNEDVYADVCPEEKPILKDGKCVMTYCTKEEYENKICIVSNPVVKTQWMDEFPYVSAIDKPLYSTYGQMSNDDILLESNIGNPFSDRKIYTLNEKSRGFFDEDPFDVIDLKSDLFSTYGNGALFKINGNINYMRLSNHETLELYDLYQEKYTFAKLESKLDYKIESYKNSLLKTAEENTFIYAYITTGNHLVMSKFKIISNDANDCLELIKTSFEDFTTISKNSRRCIITQSQYIECIELTEDQTYVIRLYDDDLNFLNQYPLEKNKAPIERAYYTYHEALWLTEDISIFVYYNDISAHNAKPKVLVKNLKKINGKIELVDASIYLDNIILYKTLPYIVSDSENSLAKINEYYFALATITSYENSNLIIAIFNLYNENDSLVINYFVLPLKDLYDVNYYSNLQAFGYKNTLGVQFEHKKGNEYRSGFIIFGFGNSTDAEIVDNIFTENDKYIINPSKYIKLQNNLFCYTLLNIIITDIPDAQSNIVVQRNNDKKTVLKKGDILSLNEEIIVTYKGNKNDIPRGNYIISFTPYLNEPDAEDHYECSFDEENLGMEVPTVWRPDEYYGRTFNFEFTVDKCFENCMTCKLIGSRINDQKCDTCLPEFYFVEGTKNCFDEPPEGYYLDENEQKYKKCYENCKTCTKKGEVNNHNCLTCKENYFLFKNKNCLNCKSINKYVNYAQTECIDEIPDGYYLNDTELNTMDKCYPNCLTCKSKGTSGNDMKCTSCNNYEGYFFYLNTKNCKKMPMPGYYIEKEDNRIKKCDISCATCSYRAIFNEENEVTNCDTCNKDLGFYNKNGNTTICINKTREGEYYDENCKCYRKCHKNCLTCSGAAIDEYHMNCLTCDIKKGYEYFSETSNCLNCKSINKIVNIDKTECIDDTPPGYFVNDTDSNTLDYCHENCILCSKAPSNENQNCLLCKSGLYLNNGNCIRTMTCPYKFYYKAKIDKSAYSTEKICLKKDEICPSNLPFYYTNTNECVENCPLDLLFYQGCKISNPNYGINIFILLIKINFMQGFINTMSKSFSLYAFNNIVIKISIFDLPIFGNLFNFRNLKNENIRQLQLNEDELLSFQSLSDDNMTKINITNDFEESNINLGDCEKKLREYYNIPDNVSLAIIKLDYKKNDSKISQIEYEIFNPKNRSEKLDLSICSEEKIKVINPINIVSNKINNLIPSDNNMQFTELSEFLYKDICSKFISEDGAYVLTQDRILDYNYEKDYCQKGCTIKEINATSGNVICLCPPNNGFGNITIENIYKEEILNIENELMKNDNKYSTNKYSNTNIKALKCAKNIFSSEGAKNYIFIIFTILFAFYLGLFIYNIIFRYKNIKFLDNINSNSNKEIKIENKPKKTKSKNEIPKTDDRLQSSKMNKNAEIKDIENYNFDQAKEYYKNKSFINILMTCLEKRDLIVSFKDKNSIKVIRALILVLSLINYFAVNTFFFSEKNIHQIYLDKNVYNFSYQFKYIISSLFISFIFVSFAKYFYSIRKYNCTFWNSKLMSIIACAISSAIFFFYWLYIGSVTSLYINIKKHLIINTILCFLFVAIFDGLISLTSAALRYFSINYDKKKMYEISQFINRY